MKVLLIVLVLLVIFYVVLFVTNMIHMKKVPLDTIIALTGSPGTGKSLIGVRESVKAYKRIKLLVFLRLIKVNKNEKQPELFSNTPIYLGRRFIFFGRKRWSKQITLRHLLMIDRLPEYSVIFIDEIGDFASQYDYDNPFVMQYIQEFIRFCRHYLDCRIFLTDQSSNNIVIAVRRRISKIYNLSSFRRYYAFFYKVDVNELIITEDIVNFNDSSEDEKSYFFGYLPFKFLKFLNLPILKRYDSRAYSVNYLATYSEIPFKEFEQYKCTYFIDLPRRNDIRKEYQRYGFLPYTKMLEYLTEWEHQVALNDNLRRRYGMVGVGNVSPTKPNVSDVKIDNK